MWGRLFAAIELPEPLAAALAGLVEGLRGAQLDGVRLAGPRGIHLTLKFLGEVPEDRVEAVVGAVARAAAERDAFDLALEGTGGFPAGDAPRVLWVGVTGQLPELASLQGDVEAALEPLGFAGERRPFHPHLTVARIRDGTSKEDRRRALEALSAAGLPDGLWMKVSAVVLMKSVLLPGGAEYERLASMPLRELSG